MVEQVKVIVRGRITFREDIYKSPAGIGKMEWARREFGQRIRYI